MADQAKDYTARIEELRQLGQLSPQAEELIAQMGVRIQELEQRNERLRKAVRAQSGTPRMSSKLKDALYE